MCGGAAAEQTANTVQHVDGMERTTSVLQCSSHAKASMWFGLPLSTARNSTLLT